MRTTVTAVLLALLLSSCVTWGHKPAVTVRGEVVRPGVYGVTPGMTVADAITAAGGYTKFSAGVVAVRGDEPFLRLRARDWKNHPEKCDVAVQDGDIIFVRRVD